MAISLRIVSDAKQDSSYFCMTTARDMQSNSQCRESNHHSAVLRLAYSAFYRVPSIPRALVNVTTQNSVE